MASLKQIRANQLNAQHSTGPRTEAGKAIVRLNALKSGIDAKLTIIPGEDPAALEQLTAEFIDRYQPVTPEARTFVDILITSEWQLRRLRRAEAMLWAHSLHYNKEKPFPMANAVGNNFTEFDRLQRRIDATQRNFTRALAELRKLANDPLQPSLPGPVAEATAPELTLVPAMASPTEPSPAPFPIGFVTGDSPVPGPEGRRIAA